MLFCACEKQYAIITSWWPSAVLNSTSTSIFEQVARLHMSIELTNATAQLPAIKVISVPVPARLHMPAEAEAAVSFRLNSTCTFKDLTVPQTLAGKQGRGGGGISSEKYWQLQGHHCTDKAVHKACSEQSLQLMALPSANELLRLLLRSISPTARGPLSMYSPASQSQPETLPTL